MKKALIFASLSLYQALLWSQPKLIYSDSMNEYAINLYSHRNSIVLSRTYKVINNGLMYYTDFTIFNDSMYLDGGRFVVRYSDLSGYYSIKSSYYMARSIDDTMKIHYDTTIKLYPGDSMHFGENTFHYERSCFEHYNYHGIYYSICDKNSYEFLIYNWGNDSDYHVLFRASIFIKQKKQKKRYKIDVTRWDALGISKRRLKLTTR